MHKSLVLPLTQDAAAQHLTEVVEKSRLRQLADLMNWVNSQLVYGWNERPVTHDGSAEDILAKASAGARFVCGTFSQLFYHLVTQAGYEARQVVPIRDGMEDADGSIPDQWYSRHRVCEVDIGVSMECWVLFDPTNNQYFLNDEGEPHNAATIQGTHVSGGVIVPVHGVHTPRRAAGPAYARVAAPEMREGSSPWREVLSAEQVDGLHQWLDSEDHLVYYDHLVYLPNVGGEPTFLLDRGGTTLARHWGKPLYEALSVPAVKMVTPDNLYK